MLIHFLARQEHPSQGIEISWLIDKPANQWDKQCGNFNYRPLIFQLKEDGSYWLLENQISKSELKQVVHSVFEYRHVRVAYLLVSPNASLQEVVHYYEVIKTTESDAHVGLYVVKDKPDVSYYQTKLVCGVNWPKDEFDEDFSSHFRSFGENPY